MKYISHFLNQPAYHAKQRQGILKDWVMSAGPNQATISGLLIEDENEKDISIDISEMEFAGSKNIHLKKPLAQCQLLDMSDQMILLAEHILDKQVIDIKKKKVYRVNDVEVAEEDGKLVIRWVDAGITGIMQRLGLRGKVHPVFSRFQRRIHWADIEPIDPDLKGTFTKLAQMHPADIADIVEELGVTQGADLIERLDDETAAETLTEVEPEMQSDIVEEIEPEDAADIIEEMEPDDAADLISDLPKETAQEIMEEMEPEEKDEVEELLRYPETSAGGIMNSEFLSALPGATAGEVLAMIRCEQPEPEMAYNIVVTDPDHKLLGILSLRDLVVAEPGTAVRDIMRSDLPSVKVGSSLKKVADHFNKYDLVALPVVNDESQVQGLITVDDLIEIIVPQKWKISHRKRRT